MQTFQLIAQYVGYVAMGIFFLAMAVITLGGIVKMIDDVNAHRIKRSRKEREKRMWDAIYFSWWANLRAINRPSISLYMEWETMTDEEKKEAATKRS